MIYDAYNLIKGETYQFMIRYDLENNIHDKLPHYYIGTFEGLTNDKYKNSIKNIWVFSNVINQETKNIIVKKQIKHFGILNPSIEIFSE